MITAAIIVLEDLAEVGRRFARDCDRLALLLRSLNPPPSSIVDLRFTRRSRRI